MGQIAYKLQPQPYLHKESRAAPPSHPILATTVGLYMASKDGPKHAGEPTQTLKLLLLLLLLLGLAVSCGHILQLSPTPAAAAATVTSRAVEIQHSNGVLTSRVL